MRARTFMLNHVRLACRFKRNEHKTETEIAYDLPDRQPSPSFFFLHSLTIEPASETDVFHNISYLPVLCLLKNS